MENLGRCSRCGKFMIAEESRRHKCDFRDVPIRGCEEIVLDHLTDSGVDKNGDQLHLAWALNGMLYRLLVCKHNPPHSTKRKFTDENPNGNLTAPIDRCWIVYVGQIIIFCVDKTVGLRPGGASCGRFLR